MYRWNVSVPFRFVGPVIVAVSFGSQFCAVARPTLPTTTTSSFSSRHADGVEASVFGRSPLYEATQWYVPGASGVKLTGP